MEMIPSDFWTKCQEHGKATGADPELLAAIGRHETDFGTEGAGRQGYALGYGVYGPTNLDTRFQGLDNQLHYAGAQIARYFKGRPVTSDLVHGFMNDSWKPGDPHWADGVWYWYNNLAIPGQATAPVSQPSRPVDIE